MPHHYNFYRHAYARGVDKRLTFLDDVDFTRFFLALTLSLHPSAPSMSNFLNLIRHQLIAPQYFTRPHLSRIWRKPKINILSLVLMPNHFHLHLQFSALPEVSKFLQRLIGSYTKYFNTRHQREGRLFSSKVKSVAIVSDEQNLYLTKYIHLNPAHSTKAATTIKDNLHQYPWSTYPQYLGNPTSFAVKKGYVFNTNIFCDHLPITKQFSSAKSYKNFIFETTDGSEHLDKKDLIDQSQ